MVLQKYFYVASSRRVNDPGTTNQMTQHEALWIAAGVTGVILCVLTYFVFSDVRRIRRGEPIKIWPLRDRIYPGDPMRPWAIWEMLGPNVLFLVGVIGAVLVVLIAKLLTEQS